MSAPYGEPKNGDFVAYIREIEQRQLAAMQRPHAPMTPAQVDAGRGASGGERKALTPEEAKQLVEKLRATGRSFSTVDMLRLVFGFVLLVTGLFGDGGLLAIAIAAALLWSPVRRIAALLRGAGTSTPKSPQDALATVFGRKPGGPPNAAKGGSDGKRT
jgi:hypothetical protein